MGIEQVRVSAPRTRLCEVPSGTLGPCDAEWGHDGEMHQSCGDGFFARQYADKHARRQGVRKAEEVRMANEGSIMEAATQVREAEYEVIRAREDYVNAKRLMEAAEEKHRQAVAALTKVASPKLAVEVRVSQPKEQEDDCG